jgi:signal transduction histidine kinase
LRSILQASAESVVRHLDAAFARIWTLNNQEDLLELQASAGQYTGLNGEYARILVGEAHIGGIAQERKAYIANDLVNDPLTDHPDWAEQERIIALAGYPLLVEGRLVGVLAMFARQGLGPDTLEALASVADTIAQGAERKQTEQTLRQANEQLHVLSRRLFQIQEDERRHLARELHDQLGQALTAAKIDLQAARLEERAIVRRLDDSIAIIERLLQQVRQLSLELRPPLLDDLGLVPALRWYLDQQAQRADLRVEFFADPALERIDAAIETACFRVAQEALTNVVRHARARTVSVELDRTPEVLHLVVRDDGIGFDVATAQQGASLGLLGMRERVALVGGELDCKSAPDRGTEVHAFFPVRFRPGAQEPGP